MISQTEQLIAYELTIGEIRLFGRLHYNGAAATLSCENAFFGDKAIKIRFTSPNPGSNCICYQGGASFVKYDLVEAPDSHSSVPSALLSDTLFLRCAIDDSEEGAFNSQIQFKEAERSPIIQSMCLSKVFPYFVPCYNAESCVIGTTTVYLTVLNVNAVNARSYAPFSGENFTPLLLQLRNVCASEEQELLDSESKLLENGEDTPITGRNLVALDRNLQQKFPENVDFATKLRSELLVLQNEFEDYYFFDYDDRLISKNQKTKQLLEQNHDLSKIHSQIVFLFNQGAIIEHIKSTAN